MKTHSDIKEKIKKLKSGSLTCTENVEYFLSKIKEKNKEYNIVLEINNNALNEAKDLDNNRENNSKKELYGLVFMVKSNISVKGLTISCASKTLENYKGTFDADVIVKIKEQGGIILGVLNNDEFASGSSGQNSAFKPTINPKAPKRVPGGSSSAPAAAIAAEFCDVALGTDTGGSIRNPASHCGIIGIKPSYGRVSRYGLVDLSMSLDQIGPLSAELYTSALVLKNISGESPNDPTTLSTKVEDYTLSNTKTKHVIGIIREFEDFIEDKRIKDLYNKKIEKLKKEDHEIVELSIKHIDLSVQAYYPIVYTEFFSGTRKFDSIKYGKKIEENSGAEVLRRIFGGKEISRSEFDGAYYKKALNVKKTIAKEFEKAFNKVDFIFTPVTHRLPNFIDEELSPEEMYAYDAFTIPANLAGICAGVVSKDLIKESDEEIPIGFQIFAGKNEEKKMFEGLRILEKI